MGRASSAGAAVEALAVSVIRAPRVGLEVSSRRRGFLEM